MGNGDGEGGGSGGGSGGGADVGDGEATARPWQRHSSCRHVPTEQELCGEACRRVGERRQARRTVDRSSSRCHAWSRSRIHQNPLLARGMWWRCVMTRTVGGSDRGRVGACEWWSSIKYRDEIRCSSQISGYVWRTNDQRGRVCGREHHGSSAEADSVMSESIVVLCCIVPLRSGLHWSKSCRGDDSQHSRCSLHSPFSPQRESCLIRCGHVPKRLSAHPRPTPPPEGAVFAVARRRRGGTTHHGARVGWGTSGLCRFCSRRCTARSPSLFDSRAGASRRRA